MMNSNIFLINLPDNISKDLLVLLKDEKLGKAQSIVSDETTLPVNLYLTNTDYVIFYIDTIDEESLSKLEVKEGVPTLLITSNLSFEMVRTAKEQNIDRVIDETDSDLISQVYGFIRQHDIYRFQHALIVDDSRVDSSIVANILNKEFITNEIELNTEKVLERLTSNQKINILILDYEMPFKNGCQLMQQIKETFTDRSFIIIGLTGSRNGATKFLTYGADDVFIKPLDSDIFTLKLRRLIFNAHKTNKEARSLNDYKQLINSITKEIYNPIYTLTTVNDCLLEKKVSKDNLNSFKDISLACKERLTHAFDDLLSYFAVSSYMQSSLVKSHSLQSMIATQLFLESSKEKLRNVIVNKSLDADVKDLCVPDEIGQVINQLTRNAVMRSQKGGEVNVRLFSRNNDIVFEVADAQSDLLTSQPNSIPQNYESQVQPINQLLCEKILNQYDGCLGVHQESTGNVHYFTIPQKAFLLSKSMH